MEPGVLTGAQRGGGEGRVSGTGGWPWSCSRDLKEEATRQGGICPPWTQSLPLLGLRGPRARAGFPQRSGRRRAEGKDSGRSEAGGRSRVRVCGEQPPRGGCRGAWGEAGLPQQTGAGSLWHAWLQQLCRAPQSKLPWKSGTRSVCSVQDEARLCAETPRAPSGHAVHGPATRGSTCPGTCTCRPRSRQMPRTPAWRGPQTGRAVGAAGRPVSLGTALRPQLSGQHCRHPVPPSCGPRGVTVVLRREAHPWPSWFAPGGSS